MKSKPLALFALIAFAVAPAFASDVPTGGQSAAVADADAQSLLNRVRLSYFGIFHGNALNDLSSTQALDRNGVPSKTSNINFDGDITGAYMLSDSVGVGPHVPFLLVPVQGKGFVLGDVGVKVSDRRTVSVGGFNLSTNLYLQVPTSDASKDRDMSFAIKSTPHASYHPAGSRLSVGSFTELKTYLGVTRYQTFKMVAIPYVKYQLLPDVALNLEYEMDWRHNVGMAGMRLQTYQTDLMPGVVWNITRAVSFNPYLQLFTTQSVSSERMALGAILSAQFL